MSDTLEEERVSWLRRLVQADVERAHIGHLTLCAAGAFVVLTWLGVLWFYGTDPQLADDSKKSVIAWITFWIDVVIFVLWMSTLWHRHLKNQDIKELEAEIVNRGFVVIRTDHSTVFVVRKPH